ncbi:MAG TPA: ribose-phosphate pyrophosphokinase [Casimicrobiaceae bacterium]|nr:ribose-phosphate pyrophosphokinase [Casimicrobiaceae bacterium]
MTGRSRAPVPARAVPDHPPLLFAPAASRLCGEAVALALGIALAEHEERVFEDGEHKLRPAASVRERDVYVLHSLHAEPGQSIDDKLVRLLFFIGALKDAAARRVTAVVPYLAYSRKDRKTKPRDPVTTRYVAQLFEAVGADCVVTLDVHNLAAFQNAFRCRTEHLEAAPLFVSRLAPRLADEPIAVVSPDAGGIKRADAFRQRLSAALGRPLSTGFVEKYRGSGALSGEALAGDVEGKLAIVVDDLIAAGNTVARAASACRHAGAKRVIAVATHGVFAAEADRVLGAAAIDEIFVTDSIPPLGLGSPAVRERLRVVSAVPLLAEAIRRLHLGESLGELSA